MLDPGSWSVSFVKPFSEIGAFYDPRGEVFLVEAAAETFSSALKSCFSGQPVTNISDRISLAEQYFAFLGMGRIHMTCSGDGALVSVLLTDDALGTCRPQPEEWFRLVTVGYIKAACAAVIETVTFQKIAVSRMHKPNDVSAEQTFQASWPT